MTTYNVGDRVAYRSSVGLREELLIEQVDGIYLSGRGVTILTYQVTEVVARG